MFYIVKQTSKSGSGLNSVLTKDVVAVFCLFQESITAVKTSETFYYNKALHLEE